ncbi:MAG: hypothetical protein JW706_00050 [Opitutales bacterium]|nr:hypothetical protein [Opitutales bacterium]
MYRLQLRAADHQNPMEDGAMAILSRVVDASHPRNPGHRYEMVQGLDPEAEKDKGSESGSVASMVN